jgi:uncharacterized protein (TIGR00661 family)
MKILFGVFDWGLGHATRDIYLIEELLKKHQVSILSTGRAFKLLKNRFADRCSYYDVPSIYPPYTRTPFFRLNFTLRSPQMIRSLRNARRKSAEIIDTGFDKVISDCRYDVYDRPDNSYLINHQLRFKAAFGAERIFEKWLAARMRKYKYVIVPDYEGKNLSGDLAHNLRYIEKSKVKYIGILSQLKKIDVPEDIEYFISLSGPEPQRTILEKKILLKLRQLEGKIVVAGGNPTAESEHSVPNAEFHNFLSTEQQQNIANRAKFIITRSGYTTIMEMAELNKKRALLVPTPGQTEQEYLADYYEQQRYFHHVSQYRLRLKRDIRDCAPFKGFDPPWRTAESVRKFIEVVGA